MTQADERWTAALDSVGAVGGDRDGVFAALVASYGEPGRHYHDLRHASSVVDVVLGLHDHGDDWAPVVLAAWFHDVVYDPTVAAGGNEGASVVHATQALRSLCASRSSTGEVARLVCLTADHLPAPGDRNGALLCDADLAVLAADGEAYEAAVSRIRAEYAHVSDADWVRGRRQVLRSFLDRPRIFHTLSGRERWESRARINISAELAGLGETPAARAARADPAAPAPT